MKILSFAASNSRRSINRMLLEYASRYVSECKIEYLDLNDYEMPVYSIDREQESGIPEKATRFLQKIQGSDGLLVSFAEHNGMYTAAFKNILDWSSRINTKIYQNKPIVMLATSPGKGGANSVLSIAKNSAQFFDGIVVGSLSVPQFNENFDSEQGVMINRDIDFKLKETVENLLIAMQK
ncbi:MAG: NAD(P)H-dependent oxidoreductase [Pseudomonadales bacterium]|nr:NAD(P)H-dependent oxidoreductase [Pseudomonadales bacterium]